MKISPDGDYDDDVDVVFHIVVWANHEDSDFLDSEPGYYSVFGIEYGLVEKELIAEYAEMFCFYDGKDPYKDDRNNPVLMSKDEAIKYMILNFPEYEVIK